MFETTNDEDHPIIEKGEHNGEEYSLGDEHFIPVKGEHHFEEEDEYVNAEHFIPHKDEHHEKDFHRIPKDKWKADYHGYEEAIP